MGAQIELNPAWSAPVKWIAGAAAVLIALGAFIWASRASDPAGTDTDAANRSLPLVSVMSPGLTPVTASVTFTGEIAARHDMPIGAEGEGGRIVAVLAEAGDRVSRNQVLARLDQSVLRPQVRRLQAALEEARAQAALSAAEFHRAQSMEASGALSLEEIERRRAAAVTDEAKVRVAAAMLAEAQARLEKTEIRAPEAGVVLTRTAEVGQTATPAQPLFRLARAGEVEMRGQVAERDFAQLEVDQPARVHLTGISKAFEGRVRLLGAVIDPQTRLGEIRIALASDPALRPGAFARGEVIVSHAQRPVLPQTAVLSDSRGTYVFIVNEQNKIERRPVRVASATADGIVIAEGLTGQERVVTTAGGFLREGERVVIAPSQSGANA